MFKVSVKNNISFPDLKLTEELIHIANNIIIPEIKNNMIAERSINLAPYPPLSPLTLKIKRLKGQSLKILEATGRLRKSIFSKRLSAKQVLISIKSNRFEVADKLQNIGVRTKRGKRFFNFFGINSIAEKRARDYVELKIREKINARR